MSKFRYLGIEMLSHNEPAGEVTEQINKLMAVAYETLYGQINTWRLKFK